MSASEMMYLVMYFSILIGDIVLKDTLVWIYYLLLQQILDNSLSKSINHKKINHLELLREALHEASLKIFGAFKPKTHNMLHYVKCLRRFCPFSTIDVYRQYVKTYYIIFLLFMT